MFTRLREKLNTPGAQYAIAAFALSYGVRRLVDLAHASRTDLDELVELHAETRTRVFALETIEEGRRALSDPVDTGVPGVELCIDQATEEVQQ